MAANTQYVTMDILRNAPLPTHGKSYSVIPHSFIIDETKKELQANGFDIVRELYKVNKEGQIAQGIYHLGFSSDADMGMMFAWSNSYNKTMKFKCAVGAQVFICMNGVVSGDFANYSRKHSGPTALNDALSSIKHQIKNAFTYYNQLVQDKEMLKTVNLSKKDQSALLGRLFADEEILTTTQTTIVKREMNTPTFNYNADPNSAWAMYNHVTLALKESHPINYLSDHQQVHQFFVNEFGQLITPGVPPTEDVQPDVQVMELETEEVESSDNEFGVIFS